MSGWRDYPIDHLGIAVERLDVALGFYCALLGMRAGGPESVEAEGVNLVMLKAGEARLELLEPSRQDSPVARFLARRGPGLHHVALRVEDLDALTGSLQAAGVRLLQPIRQSAGGYRYAFVHPASTGGVLIELVERSSKEQGT